MPDYIGIYSTEEQQQSSFLAFYQLNSLILACGNRVVEWIQIIIKINVNALNVILIMIKQKAT